MKASKKDEIRQAIIDGKTNYEIRRDIDGRLSDRLIDQMRSEDPVIEGAMQAIFPEMETADEAAGAGEEPAAGEEEPPVEAEPPAEGAEEQAETPVAEGQTEKIGGALRVTRIDLSGILLYSISTNGLRIGPKGDNFFVPAEELDLFVEEISRLRNMHKMHFAREQ